GPSTKAYGQGTAAKAKSAGTYCLPPVAGGLIGAVPVFDQFAVPHAKGVEREHLVEGSWRRRRILSIVPVDNHLALREGGTIDRITAPTLLIAIINARMGSS